MAALRLFMPRVRAGQGVTPLLVGGDQCRVRCADRQHSDEAARNVGSIGFVFWADPHF